MDGSISDGGWRGGDGWWGGFGDGCWDEDSGVGGCGREIGREGRWGMGRGKGEGMFAICVRVRGGGDVDWLLGC